KWSIEGEENSKFFHGIINKKRNNLAIYGVTVDVQWIKDPIKVKNEFLAHFKERFDFPCKNRLMLEMTFPNKLSSGQSFDLERPFLTEDIKEAVWNCGKSPGLDGFTFDFYRKFWNLLKEDVVAAVNQFYLHGYCQKGGIALDYDFQLSYLFYEDDVVFLGQWRDSNLSTILHVLECFFRATGLRINLHKSSLIGIAMDSSLVDDATNKIGCMATKLPFPYLGIIIGDHMSCIKAWDNVINKVLGRLSKWKMKSLSIGGRLTLLKAMLGLTLLYYMSMFRVPLQVLKKLESVRCHFFNGVDPNVQKMLFVKWNNVLASKEKGSLCVPSFYGLDRALIFKRIWRFRSQTNSIWFRVIKALHVVDGAFGAKPRFLSNSYEITQIIPSLLNKGGVGNLSSDGKFSVSSLRCFFDDKSITTVGSKTRWNKYVPSKVNILAWRIKHDFLPTCLNISRRGIDLNSITCVSCTTAIETTSHIFSACPLVNLLYKKIPRWWNVIMTEMSSYEEWWAWFSALRLENKIKKIFEGVFYFTWWLLWNFCNKSIFGPIAQPKARLFDDILAFSFTWCRSRCKANFSWLTKKLKILKGLIRSCVKDKKDKAYILKYNLKKKIADIDSLLNNGKVSSVALEDRSNAMNILINLEKIESIEVAQKAKIKWSIEVVKRKAPTGIVNIVSVTSPVKRK
nr:RNA-directed DNA polymerase, eukaryota, reverse transcriptase zinc-binding domain protein [Tanacetum cinerariifolium]